MTIPLPANTSPLWVLVVVFAAWRVTAFVCYEAGPFDLGTRLRRILASAGLARMVTCFHCTGVWVSLALTMAVFELRWVTLLLAAAVAGGVSVLERSLGGGGEGEMPGSTTEEN